MGQVLIHVCDLEFRLRPGTGCSDDQNNMMTQSNAV
jgi:hypothetical protein